MATPRVTQRLSRAARALTRAADAHLTPLGLRYAQVPVIVLLQDNETMTQKQLAEAVGVEQPSMAELLHRMERGGLICRVANPHDARSRLIKLGPNVPHLEDAAAQLVLLEERTVNGLSKQEVQTLVSLLTKIADNLQDV